MGKLKDLEHKKMKKVEVNIKEILKIIYLMEKVFLNGEKIQLYMMENIKMD